jgi:SAM-dependent methyltransferase
MNRTKHHRERHWYDGGPYALFMDPMAGRSFAGIMGRLIEPGAHIIDIGCGTGALVFSMADNARQVTGVDASEGMIRYAERQAARNGRANVNFLCMPAQAMPGPLPRDYDYAVMTQFLHEVPEEVRTAAINAAREMAKRAVIADFIAPFPGGVTGTFMRMVEFAAGREHNRCFRDWLDRGGLEGFMERHGLTALEERRFKTGVGKIVKISF